MSIKVLLLILSLNFVFSFCKDHNRNHVLVPIDPMLIKLDSTLESNVYRDNLPDTTSAVNLLRLS